ncbi:hypothetical protein IJ750_05460 [bacterium]|nr:hypothetical protein [bacterium]
MKKQFLFIIFFLGIFGYTQFNQQIGALPNPWVDCGDSIYCGAKKAGFNLPLRVKNYSVRAMEDMLEITFPLDKKRDVSVRKTCKYTGAGDISGVYEDYPIVKTIKLNNGVIFNVKGIRNKIYIANFAAESGYYSIYCKKGMTNSDIEYIYEILAEAESKRDFDEEKSTYSIDKLRKLRTVDGIVEPVYTQDCFPRTLQKVGVTKDCFERANLGEYSACTESQVKMIKEYFKKGYKHDPLNNGCGEFCAE